MQTRTLNRASMHDALACCLLSRVLTALSISVFLPGMLAVASYTAPQEIGQTANLPGPSSDLPDVGITQKLGATVPLDLTFRDELNQKVSLSDYFKAGRPVVLSLGYYECPMLCGEVMHGMLSAFREITYTLGSEFAAVTVSINPKETPSLAAQKRLRFVRDYARPGSEDGWHFLSGDKDAIETLASTVGFGYQFDPNTGEFAHGSGIMILTPGGKVSKYLAGIIYPVEELKAALDAAADERTGSLVENFIRLLCYHYDPLTGTYSVSIIKAVRIGGIATLLGLIVTVAYFVFAEQRKKRTRGVVGGVALQGDVSAPIGN